MTEPPVSAPPPPPMPAAPPAGGAPLWTLIAGLGLIAVLAFGVDLARVLAVGHDYASEGVRASLLRLQLIDSGLWFATRIMLVVGAVELWRRTSGTARLGAQLALVGAAVGLGVLVVRYAVQLSVKDPLGGESLMKALQYAVTAGEYLMAAGLVLAAWHVKLVRILAAPYLVATVVAFPLPFLADIIYAPFRSGSYERVMIAYGVTMTVARVLAAVIVWQGTPATAVPAAYERGASGFDRAASALYARLYIALGGIMLFLTMMGSREGGMTIMKLFIAGVPAANAIAGVVLGAGVLAGAAMAVPASVCVRLVVAAGALLWTVGVQLMQASIAFRAFSEDTPDGETIQHAVQALSIALPIVNAIAMAMIAHAVSGIGRAVGNVELERAGLSSVYASLICNLAGVGLTYATASQKSAGSALTFMGLALVLVIIALVSVARVCRQAASVLRARATADLPVAVARDGGAY